jgi:hypothetical protein
MALALQIGTKATVFREERMAKAGDPSDQQSAEEAATPDTAEPAEATRVRAEDDAETRERQEQTEAGLREADRTLEDGGARLKHTRAELRKRERELERTGEITREVAANAADLRAQMAQISEQARRSPRPESKEKDKPSSD